MGFAENIPRLEARRMLRQLRHHPRQLTGNEVYELVKAETGDEEAAQDAARQYVHQQKVIEAYQQARQGQ
jgi:hypothetical protein